MTAVEERPFTERLPKGCLRYPNQGADWRLTRFAVEDLHKLSYEDCLRFYEAFRLGDPSEANVAPLWLCDRYFLVTTGILNGKEAIHGFTSAAELSRPEPAGYLDLWARNHHKIDVHHLRPVRHTPSVGRTSATRWPRHCGIVG